MELTDIMALVKAGYTKDEIAQMEQTPNPVPNPDPVPTPVDKPTQADEPTPAPVNEPTPAPTPAPVPTPAQDEHPSMADVMQSIAKLTSAIQANAIEQSRLPAGGFQQPTAEDMVAEIIRPTYKERGG